MGFAIKEEWKKEWESPEFHGEMCVTGEEGGRSEVKRSELAGRSLAREKLQVKKDSVWHKAHLEP